MPVPRSSSKLIGVTGATGFVGGHLVSTLRQAGHQVRVLVRDRSKLAGVDELLDIVEGDLNNRGALDALCDGVDCVVHVAGAIAGLTRQDFFDVNETGSINVARAAVKADVPRFIQVSSLAARQPHLSHYAASKDAGEKAAGDILPHERLIIARPCAVYGEGDKATLPLIKVLTQRVAVLPGTKHQQISWVHVKDLVSALVCLAQNDDLPNEVVEISDGKQSGYLWSEMIALAGNAQGRKIGLVLLPRFIVSLAAVFADIWAKTRQKPDVFSREKVNEIYFDDWVATPCEIEGWAAKIGFEQGFGDTLLWYQQNGWLPRA